MVNRREQEGREAFAECLYRREREGSAEVPVSTPDSVFVLLNGREIEPAI